MCELVVSAPGKVILHGEHSVVYGKTAIAMSLNLRTTLKLSASSSSNNLDFHLLNYPSKRWSMEDIKNAVVPLDSLNVDVSRPVCLSAADQLSIKHLITKEINFSPIDFSSVAVIFLTKLLFFKSRFKGLKLEVESEIPMGAGMGSSASFSVCLSTAFLFLAGALNEEGGSTSDLELINKWAYVVEQIFHGNPSGIDNHTASYGGAIVYKSASFSHLEKYKTNLLYQVSDFHQLQVVIKKLTNKCNDSNFAVFYRETQKVFCTPPVKLLMVNTMVQRITKDIVEDVRKRKSKYPDIIEPVLESMDHVASTCVQTLKRNDLPHAELHDILEDLIDMNQGLLNVLNVSHPKLQEIFTISAKYHFHAKLTGAGRGGFAFLLIRPDTPIENIDGIQKEFDKRGFQYFHVVVGGPGVQLKILS